MAQNPAFVFRPQNGRLKEATVLTQLEALGSRAGLVTRDLRALDGPLWDGLGLFSWCQEGCHSSSHLVFKQHHAEQN